MKNYTVIGTMFTNIVRDDYRRGIMFGVCRSLRGGNSATCVVYMRIKDENILRPEPNTQPQGRDNKENT